MEFKNKLSGYLGIDIGGTWIKGTFVNEDFFDSKQPDKYLGIPVHQLKSPLNKNVTPEDLIGVINELIRYFDSGFGEVKGVGISTAGIVDYAGGKVLKAAEHLNVLKNDCWKKELERHFQCCSVLINDADAAAIGIAELGGLNGNKTVGIMPIGTGLGFSVWRNGRRWRPGKMLNLLGSIRTPVGYFDNIASASALAGADPGNNLITVFTKPLYEREREAYLQNLAKIINTAAIIYNLDEVMICGGLADAVTSCGYPLESEINFLLLEKQVELDKVIRASVLEQGNKLQLIGAVSLAKGEAIAKANRISKEYKTIITERPYQQEAQLQNLSASDLVKLFWHAEQEAGGWLEKSLPVIEQVVDAVLKSVIQGGRIIYVGAGTSGRVAAMDAVEIPCTYGFPEDRILCLIAGGVADAAIEIESDFEEDASAVPEMLLLNIKPEDVVIGISASGTAYYVQSALAFAKERGGYSVMIQNEAVQTASPFCETTIPLNAGYEVVAGSTRMKSGTATKKVLNFISSSVMVKLGKVQGSYMVDVACINDKLIKRAQAILKTVFQLNEEESMEHLKEADMKLNVAIRNINRKKKK